MLTQNDSVPAGVSTADPIALIPCCWSYRVEDRHVACGLIYSKLVWLQLLLVLTTTQSLVWQVPAADLIIHDQVGTCCLGSEVLSG